MSACSATAACWHFDGIGDIHVQSWAPEKSAENAVLLLHGVESHAGWFDELAPLLAQEGYAVYAVDRPGWGQSPGPRGHVASYADLVHVFDCVATRIQKDHLRIHLAGMSWGGKLALYLALRRPCFFQSLTMIAPGLFPARGPGLFAGAGIAAGWLSRVGSMSVPLRIRDDDFTSRPDRTAFIANDPLRVRRVTSSFCVESLKMGAFIKEHIGQLRLPWRLLLAEHDTVIRNAPTEALLAKVGGVQHETVTLPDCRHTLVYERPEVVAREIHAVAQASMLPHPQPRNILVAGAGAVGSMVGGLLAHAGHHVALLGRLPHISAIRDEGLQLKLGDGECVVDRNLHGITALNQLREPPELVFLTVKGFHGKQMAEEMAAFLPAGVPVVSLQNGVDNERMLVEVLTGHPIVAGSICAYLSFEAPGRVHWLDDLGGVALAAWSPDAAAGTMLAHDVLQDTGLQTVIGSSGESVIWSKLMLNIAFNALNALTNLGASQIMRDPALALIAIDAMRECTDVMAAKGIAPMALPGYRVDRLARVVRLPRKMAQLLLRFAVKNDGGAKSSMAQDLARHRSVTEIDAINGVIVCEAKMHGLPARANAFLTECVSRAAEDESFQFATALTTYHAAQSGTNAPIDSNA